MLESPTARCTSPRSRSVRGLLDGVAPALFAVGVALLGPVVISQVTSIASE